MNELFRRASKIAALPVLKFLSPSGNVIPTEEEIAGYRECQRLAQKAVKEIASYLREGWTEAQAARLLTTYLSDCGVQGFFHHSFAWFGERTRFDGIKAYKDFSPSRRVLLPNEVFILDVAPIYKGFICDIGYTGVLGENAECERAVQFLRQLREEIPGLLRGNSGAALCRTVHRRLRAEKYDPIYERYPFSVLGHRVHRSTEKMPGLKLLNFGWQSYWAFASRGVFGQLLNENFEGDLTGLWAVEPHLGAQGFGAKFEEILLVTPDKIEWIDDRGW